MIKSGKEKKDPFMLFKRMRITRAKKNRATIMSEKSPTFPSTIRYNQLATPENYQLCLTGFVLRTNFATPPLK